MRDLTNDYVHFVENDFRMTSIIKTKILSEIGFSSHRRNGEADDWVFWLQFYGKGYKATLMDTSRFLYRFREGSMSWPWSEGQMVGTQQMLDDVMLEIINDDSSNILSYIKANYVKNMKF